MGYESISTGARTFLQEAARLAYGSGNGEGRNGGSGRMGVLVDNDGSLRMIKFNTHWTERLSGSKTQGMIDSSNVLREKLIEIAKSAGLEGEQLEEIRESLGLPARGNVNTTDELLNRSSVAQVVSLIGGDEVWNDIMPEDGNFDGFVSDADTTFTRLKNRQIVSKNAKDFVALTAGVFRSKLSDAVGVFLNPRPGVEGANSPQMREFLTQVINEAFSGEFCQALNEGNGFGFTNVDKLKSSLVDLVRTLMSLEDPLSGDAQKDPAAIRHYLARQLQVRCLELVDPLRVGTYGLERQDLELLKSLKLMPEDVMTGMRSGALKFSSIELDNKKDAVPLPEIPPAALWRSLRAASVHAVALLRRLDPDERGKKAGEIRRAIREGGFGGFVLGVFAAESNTVDFNRHMSDLLSNRMDRLGNLGSLVIYGVGSSLMNFYRDRHSDLYRGVKNEHDVWRSFVTMVSQSDFKLLSGATTYVGIESRLRFLGRVFSALPEADLVTLRESGLDCLNFLCDFKGSNDPTIGHRLAELIRQVKNDGQPLVEENLKTALNAFWDHVSPADVLGLENGVELSENELSVFKSVASCYPDVALQGDEEQICEKRNLACEKIRETFTFIRGEIGGLSKSMNDNADDLCGKLTSSRDLRKLTEAILSGTVEEMFETARQNVAKFMALGEEYKAFASGLVKKGLISTPLKESAFFGISIGEAFHNDMFNPDACGKLKMRLQVRKDSFERYDKLYGKALEEFRKQENRTPQRRAELIALRVVRYCLANMGGKMLPNSYAQEAFFTKICNACLKDGLLNRLDTCIATLNTVEATGREKALAVTEFACWCARFFFGNCWFGGDVQRAVHGVGPKDGIGGDEKVDGLNSTLSGLLETDESIMQFVKNEPDAFFSAMLERNPNILDHAVQACRYFTQKMRSEMLVAEVKSDGSGITDEDLELLRSFGLHPQDFDWLDCVPKDSDRQLELMKTMLESTVKRLRDAPEGSRYKESEAIKLELEQLKTSIGAAATKLTPIKLGGQDGKNLLLELTDAQSAAIKEMSADKVKALVPDKLGDVNAGDITFKGYSSVQRGKYVLCTVEYLGMGKRGNLTPLTCEVLVDREGRLINAETTAYGKLRSLLSPRDRWLADAFDSKDCAAVVSFLEKLPFKGNKDDQVKSLLWTMLPTAVRDARKLKKDGEIDLATWTKALGLEDFLKRKDVAAEESEEARILQAIRVKCFANFYHDMKLKDRFKDISEDDCVAALLNPSSENGDKYNQLMTSMCDYAALFSIDVPYEVSRFSLKTGIAPGKESYFEGCTIHRAEVDLGYGAKKTELGGGFLSSQEKRQSGTKYYVGGELAFEITGQGVNDSENAKKMVERLGGRKVTDLQIFMLSMIPIEFIMGLLPRSGYASAFHNMVVNVNRLGNGDMAVEYKVPCISGKNGAEPSGVNLVYKTVVRPDGKSKCTDYHFESAPNAAGDVKLPSVMNPTSAQVRAILEYRGDESLENFEAAQDGKTILCELRGGEKAKIDENGNVGIIAEDEYVKLKKTDNDLDFVERK